MTLGDSNETNHLKSLQLAFLRTELLPPLGLRLRKCLHARLELLDLLPPMIKLLPHIIQLLREPALRVLAPLVKVQLNLAELLESRNEVVVEDPEVGERFCFRLTAILLCTRVSSVNSGEK